MYNLYVYVYYVHRAFSFMWSVYQCVCLCYSPNKTYKHIIAGHARSELKTFKGFNIDIDISCFRAIFVNVFVGSFLHKSKTFSRKFYVNLSNLITWLMVSITMLIIKSSLSSYVRRRNWWWISISTIKFEIGSRINCRSLLSNRKIMMATITVMIDDRIEISMISYEISLKLFYFDY